jgi:hypothetical protein
MEIGIDRFAASKSGNEKSTAANSIEALAQLLERIEHADHAGLLCQFLRDEISFHST